MKSLLRKWSFVFLLSIEVAAYATEDYYSCLERVEKWLELRYDKTAVTYRARRRGLEEIDQSPKSNDEKITLLKKEYPEAFSDSTNPQDAKAQFQLGRRYSSEGNLTEAVKWYRKSAAQGYAEAECALGICYQMGWGVKPDLKQGAYWFYRAAEQGIKEAQYFLGWCFGNGKGVAENQKQALYWYRKSAEQGYFEAEYALGLCYQSGNVVEKDLVQAVYWARRSAEQGFSKAQLFMALCYTTGDGGI